MKEFLLTCLYCDNKWTFISFYSPKDKNQECSRCKETKMIKIESSGDNNRGNIFGYDDDELEHEVDPNDDYRD